MKRASTLPVACMLLLLGGCGRLGFGESAPASGGDAAADADTPTDAGSDGTVSGPDGGPDGGPTTGTDAGPGDPRNLTLSWVHPVTSRSDEHVTGVVADAESVYVAFDVTGEGSFLGSEFASAGAALVVARLDKIDGSILWLNAYETGRLAFSHGLAQGGSSPLFIAGTTDGVVDLGGVFVNSLFYGALDREDGTTLWALSPSISATVAEVASDEAGNLYVAGVFRSGSLDGMSALGRDIFLLSYDSEGGLRWSRFVSGPGTELLGSLAVGEGKVVLTGTVEDGADLGDGVPVSLSTHQPFVAVFGASDGSHQWSRVLTSRPRALVRCSRIDSAGRIYVGGTLSGDLDVGGTVLTTVSDRGFFLSYDAVGAYRWSRIFGGEGNNSTLTCTTDSEDNVYFGGYYSGSTDFGDGTMVPGHLSDGFAAAYTPDGAPLWHFTYGSESYDEVVALGVDPSGRLFMGGAYSGWFGEGIEFPSGQTDGYIAAFEPWLP